MTMTAREALEEVLSFFNDPMSERETELYQTILALRDSLAEAPQEPVGAQEMAGRETLNANYWKAKYEVEAEHSMRAGSQLSALRLQLRDAEERASKAAQSAEPQGARAALWELHRRLSERANKYTDTVEDYYLHGLWLARNEITSIIATLPAALSEPAPQEGAKVAELLERIHDDLVLRARLNAAEGEEVVVDLSNGLWSDLCTYLQSVPPAPRADGGEEGA